MFRSVRAGTSDPYVEIHINNEKTKFKTPKIKKTLDPTWNYTTEILLDNCQYLVFKVIDHNLMYVPPD
jgi:Ca2+-dependent lipid-binding protein